MTIVRATEGNDTLPAASVALATTVCVPSLSGPATLILVQLAPLFAVPLPDEVELPSTNKFTVLLASAVPLNLRFVVRLVMLSDCELPVSLPDAKLGFEGAAGTVVSMVNVAVVLPDS